MGPLHSYQCYSIISYVKYQVTVGQTTKGTSVFSRLCAITTHSSDACLHKQRLCSYRKAGGCGGGGGALTYRTSRGGVWESRRRRGVSVQARGGEEGRMGAAVMTRERRGGRAAMVAQAHKREGVGSRLQRLSVRTSGSRPPGHLEANFPPGHDKSVTSVCHLQSRLMGDRTDLMISCALKLR